MRTIHSPGRERCHECGERIDVVARGHRLRYRCWDHAAGLLEQGGLGGDLGKPR